MSSAILILGLGMPEGILIFFALLLLFGGKKIPELMRGLGKGIREFNSARANIEEEIKTGMKETDKENSDK
ncbi:MAG: twin-arginine translocase TatA/TatE family subunit [Saprospiraceae bacterium]|nr:twin-arginine translocase TatA/TatE family subunit [Saprospiraceae bacterium]